MEPEVLGAININVLGLATYDPAKHESRDQLIENLDVQLLPIFDQCYQASITTVGELMDGPTEYHAIIREHQLLPHLGSC